MSAPPSASTQRVRDQIDHPVIDSDGHMLEFFAPVRDRLREIAGESLAKGFDAMLNAQQSAMRMTPEERRNLGMFRLTWWGFPARNTLDRATAMLPKLQYERLPEQGIDFAVVYPTFGMTAPMADDGELRTALVRAFNRDYAENYAEFSDRLCPVALIPMHNPTAAIAELAYAVRTLKMQAGLLPSYVFRPLAGDNLPRAARWLDTFGSESPYDYDPVWAKCVELGVNPTFHSSAMGWHSRNSQTSYVFNHLGNFAAASETICRSLVLDGVPTRFPSLQFTFLEGGVAWACNLYSDLLSHYEKRNRETIHNYNPAELDRELMRELFERYAGKRVIEHLDDLESSLVFLADPNEDPKSIDEFARSGIESPEDIRNMFTSQFHFGCEADDPMNSLAFNTKLNPHGARLSAIFGSDMGHWDVPDTREVLSEAWELVETKLNEPEDVRASVYYNPRRMWTNNNPNFFSATTLDATTLDGTGTP